MSSYTPGIGPNNARIALVIDFPKRESTNFLHSCLKAANLRIEEIYITYVIKYPIGSLKNLKLFPISETEQINNLEKELLTLKPNIILTYSEYVLNLLTKQRNISKYRGSVLQSYLGIKVLPSLYPGYLRESADNEEVLSSGIGAIKDLTFIKWDFQKLVKESQFPEYNYRERELKVAKTSLDLYRYFNQYSDSTKVAIDIETFNTIPSCISFAFNSKSAISVPLIKFPDIEMTKSDLVNVWKDVADLLANPAIAKIGQNFKFDEDKLLKCYDDKLFFGLKVNNFWFDTNLAFKTLYPELNSGLGFLTSIYTDEPYYKEEGKGYNPKKDKSDRLLLYNAKDAVLTYEVFENELKELEERNQSEFFFTRIMPLHSFYMQMERKGLLVDQEARNLLKIRTKVDIELLESELKDLLQPYSIENINVNSPLQINKLIFITLELPRRKGTDEKTLEEMLRNVVRDEKKKRIIELILEIRKVKKLLGTYIEAQIFEDGTIKTNYRLMLETGRTSTSVCKPPITTERLGWAFQTITKGHGDETKVGHSLRSICIPHDGYIFIEPDLSQAEARIVALLANDPRLIKIFKFGVDIHRVNAAWIKNLSVPNLQEFFDCSEILFPEKIQELKNKINYYLKEIINDEDRQLGKQFVHSANYGVGKKVASIQAKIPEKLAGQILEKVHLVQPNIRQVFHQGIIDYLEKNNRTLITPFERQRTFLNSWGDEMFKEAYAFLPQSTISDHLKFSMMRIANRIPELDIRLEMHDSFLGQIKIQDLTDKNLRIIKEELETPIDFSKCSLKRESSIIPCEIQVGKNWGELKKL